MHSPLHPHFYRVFLSLLIAAAVGGCGRAASPTGVAPAKSVVTGTVSDTLGTAIAGATVTLRDGHVTPAPRAGRAAPPAALQHDVFTRTTDAAGRYAFEPVLAGEYFVTAEAGGYAATGIAFTIEAGAAGAVDTTVMNIILWPPSPVAGTRSGRP
jgi:hypothetical protein